MYMLIWFALLLTLLPELAAVEAFSMDQAMSVGSPMGSDSPLPEFISNEPCSHCALHCLFCQCPPSPSYIPTALPGRIASATHAPALNREAYEAATHLAPVRDYVYGQRHQPLMDQNVHHINANETKVHATTVLEHVKDTYTPGDRLGSSRPRPRKSPQRRQAPRPGGFPCEVNSCDRTFDRACDFNRHQKTHLGRSERPHKCSICQETFLYPKDLERHQQKHIDEPSAKTLFQCRQPGCHHTFSRRDNLLRHQRKQHSGLVGTPP